MRVTEKMGQNQVILNLQNTRSQMLHWQDQASTQKRINQPSDDPTAAVRVNLVKWHQNQNQQFLRNLEYAKTYLQVTEQAIEQLGNIFVRLKELAVAQSNSAGQNAQTRQIVAKEVRELYQQLLEIANRRYENRYIFGGTKVDQSPFDSAGRYHGNDRPLTVQLDQENFVITNIGGHQLFLGQGLGWGQRLKERYQPPQDVNELTRIQMAERHLFKRSPASNSNHGVNLFETVKDFIKALENNDTRGIQGLLEVFDKAHNQIIQARADVGARLQGLDWARDHLEKVSFDQKILRSQLEDADLLEVVNNLNQAQTTLKAALETSQRVIQPTLLDFLR